MALVAKDSANDAVTKSFFMLFLLGLGILKD
jgi:hypothetical protein